MMEFAGTNLIMPAMTEKFRTAGAAKPRGHWLCANQCPKKGENPVIRVWSNLIMPETAFRDALSNKRESGSKTVCVKSFQ